MKTIQSVGNPAVHTMFGKLVVPPYPASRDGGHSWCPLSHSQLIFAFLSWSHVSSGCSMSLHANDASRLIHVTE